ncbi:DC-STAMP domain-containing protein 2 isoform X2 [Neopsephotus bourkii]|uniref:DC-STAMP domain-containing protein 2 isoform X2 n=1 Tax=Neopsephotus bourkii TaxID=309878 RepID=UPI002AA4F68F|nr:DC-STAMP domain-containing protein 2 isoform X2 [Neopsephotus bourkii]
MGLVSWAGRRGRSPAPRSQRTQQPQEPSRGHNIWYCLITTIGLGALLGLGMAFSAKVRLTVLLSLPQIFTQEGKMLLLVLALSMAVQGPCTNVLHNFSRAAESLSCGAELALNQTAERLQHAQEPLINFLSKIKEIAQEAKAVGDRVRKFFRSIMDAVSHVARALHNVWLWLANIARVCNKELGSPYYRCLKLFDEAKDNCERTIPLLFFLCYIVSAFKPLCGLANIALMFCIVPQYIQNFIRANVATPLNDALDRVRREFEFNISAMHEFDVSFNASKSLGEVALDIMEGVSQSMEPTRRVLGLFLNVSFLAILYMYFKALRYRNRYLQDETFDNIYITRRFKELDQLRAEQGKPTVLPLTARECGLYISPAALWLSKKEHRRYGLQLVGFLRHMLLGFCIILADYSLFWLLDLVRHQLEGEIIARAPVVVGVSVNGSGYTSEIYRDLVSAFGVLQQGNISVVSQQCLIQPVEPDYRTYIFMGSLYGICLFISVFGTYVARLRRLVCATYYPSREQERTAFLHSTILAQRAGLARALFRAVTLSTADAGKGNLFLILTAKVPCFARLARLLGIQQKRCLACGVTKQPDFIACITNGCKGLYCKDCHQTLNNICTICMGPLTYPDTGDKEIDSSDEETVGLWLGAVRARRGQEQGRLLRQRIREMGRGLGGSRRLPPHLAARLRAQLKEEASGESDGGSSSGAESESSTVSR